MLNSPLFTKFQLLQQTSIYQVVWYMVVRMLHQKIENSVHVNYKFCALFS